MNKLDEKNLRFIIVDDDPINNMICKRVINKSFPNADVTTFTEPETGLIYLNSVYCKPKVGNSILFLDINMPTMTGWEFMKRFERVGTTVKEQIQIYILSSSVDVKDKESAKNNHNIIGYIEKPLTTEIIKTILAA